MEAPKRKVALAISPSAPFSAPSSSVPASLDLTTYPAAPEFTGERPGVLVLPGGGYRIHTRHEGEGYARWLSGIGVHAFVLNYRLLPDPFPGAVEEGRAALAYIRAGGHGLAVDPSRVGVIGSSAGGHLAGLLATGAVTSLDAPTAQDPPRPDFAVLAYAVADFDLLPDGAVEALLGDLLPLRDELSPVRHVDERTCPAFLWCTAEDPPGFPNTLAWAQALQAAGVSVEVHVYPHGWHGLGLADGVRYGDHGDVHLPHTAQWSGACERWLRAEGFLPDPG